MRRQRALVLLGPTGAGKTPLGDLLEAEGLQGRRCHHFDFGAQLRALAAGAPAPPGLGRGDRALAAEALERGRLLADAEFDIARALLVAFLERRDVGDDDLVVLNGVPRHHGQARDLEPLLDVCGVAYLDASDDVVRERVANDAGGDRAGRVDDDAGELARRLQRFRTHTLPLLEHYGARGAQITPLEVAADTTAPQALRRLVTLLGEGPSAVP